MFNLFFLIVIIVFIWLFQLKVMKKPFGEENGVGTCNLTPFSKPTCSKKNNSLRRTWFEPMLSLGNLATVLGGKFPNHCAIWPHFLGQVAKKRRKRVETNLPRRRGIGAWWLSLGTCKRAWNSLGNMILLQAMKERGETMFVHDNLGPFVSGNYVSTRNLSLFALGNQVSLRI